MGRELVDLIRKMSRSNVTWGAPRIRNELAKLGNAVAVSTVARYMDRRKKPSSPSWRAFLDNHVKDLVAIDFFTVPTAAFGVLFGLLVLAHDRRRVLHFNVTANPRGGRQGAPALPGRRSGLSRRHNQPCHAGRGGCFHTEGSEACRYWA